MKESRVDERYEKTQYDPVMSTEYERRYVGQRLQPRVSLPDLQGIGGFVGAGPGDVYRGDLNREPSAEMPNPVPRAIATLLATLDRQAQLIDHLDARTRAVRQATPPTGNGAEPTRPCGSPITESILKAADIVEQHNLRLAGIIETLEI